MQPNLLQRPNKGQGFHDLACSALPGLQITVLIFLLYQHHEDKKYRSVMLTQSLEWPSPNIGKLRRKGSVIISPLAAPASSLLQVWAPALVHIPDTAGWLLSGGSGLLSIPWWKPWSLFCCLGEFSCANKLQFKDACHLFWKEVTRAI